MTSIAIAGLGQIGGSLRLAIRKAYPSVRLFGADSSPAVRRLPPVDLLILACPVPDILALLGEMPCWKRLPVMVTDVGSVKRPVVQAMARLPRAVSWIGGHPLAGSEKPTPRADLFRGATWVLTKEHRGNVSAVSRLVKAMGARPVTVDAGRHDRILARTSHLPYLVACALVRSAVAEGISPAELRLLSAGGWRDMTRLALSNPAMAGGYVKANAAEVSQALNALRRELTGFDMRKLRKSQALARHVRRP